MSKRIEPRLNFTQVSPQPGEGQFHKDGTLATDAKGSPAANNNALRSAIFNEYERLFNEISGSIGDFDFNDIYPSAGIESVSDAIRRAKQEIDSIVAILDIGEEDVIVDRRFYGITTGWVKRGSTNLGAISTEYYTPGVTGFEYEPSFEIIKTENRNITVLGGRVNLPPDTEVIIPASFEDHGGYTFNVPELEFVKNVSYEFGAGMTLPTGEFNKVRIEDGKFQIPIRNRPINYAGRPVGEIETGRGGGAELFEYSDIDGSGTKQAAIVIVAGSLTDSGNNIDTNSVFVRYLGIDAFSPGVDYDNPDFDGIGYDAIIDPTTGIVKVNTGPGGLSEGSEYYIYYLEPDNKVYSLQIDTSSTREIQLENAFITEGGEVLLEEFAFPLYLVKVQYDPFLATQDVSNPSLLMYGRTSSSAEHSRGLLGITDSIVDVRQFQHKPKPLFTPPFTPRDFIERGNYISSDIHGNTSKVVPLFVPIKVDKREALQTKFGLSASSSVDDSIYVVTEDTTNKFDQVEILIDSGLDLGLATEGKDLLENQPRNRFLLNEINRLVTGHSGLDVNILGISAKVEVDGTEVESLESYGTELEVSITGPNGENIWSATGSTPGNPYGWQEDPSSERTIDNLESVSIDITLTSAPSSSVEIKVKDVQVLLSPLYSKSLSTACGQAMRYRDDWVNGADEIERVSFDETGTITAVRNIPKLEERYVNGPWEAHEPSMVGVVDYISTSLTESPKYFKVINSMVNQYVLYVSQDDLVYLMRINIADPRIFSEVQVDLNLASGQELSTWSPTTIYEEALVDLEINDPERPKVILPIKGSDGEGDYILLRVVSYDDGINENPRVNDLDLIRVDLSTYRFIGNKRSFDVDTEHIASPINMDRIDGRYLYFDSQDTVKIVRLYPHLYIDSVGYSSYSEPVEADHIIGKHFDYTDVNRILAYSENRRNARSTSGYREEFGEDSTWVHTFCLYDPIGVDVYTNTIRRDNSVEDPKDGTEIIYESLVGLTQANANSITGIRQNSYIEFLAYTGPQGSGDPLTIKVQPYTLELESEEGHNYKYYQNFSLGTVVPSTDSWHDPSIDKFDGVRWAEDSKENYVEKYQTLADAVDSLYTRQGHAYLLGNSNSDIYGFSRELRPIKGGIETKIAHVRAYPSPVSVGSESGVSKRLGRYSRTGQGEVFFSRNIEGRSDKRFNITLLSTNVLPGTNTLASYPFVLPVIGPESPDFDKVTNTEERTPLIELGSASGSGIDAGTYASEFLKEDFSGEYVHRLPKRMIESSAEKIAKLGVHREANAILTSEKIPSIFGTELPEETEATFRNLVYPTDKNWTKGYMSEELSSSAYLYETEDLIGGSVEHQVTSNKDDTVIILDRPGDIFSTGTKVFESIELLLEAGNTSNDSGSLEIEIYINDSTTASDTVTVGYVIHEVIFEGFRTRLAVTDPITDIGVSNKTTLKISEATPNLTVLQQPGTDEYSFALRRRDNDPSISLDSSETMWLNELDIRLGNRSISEPVVSSLRAPYKFEVGTIEEGRVIPFVSHIGSNDLGHGFLKKREGKNLEIYEWKDWNWKVIEIPNSVTYSPYKGIYGEGTGDNVTYTLLVKDENNDLKLLRNTTSGWEETDLGIGNVDFLETDITDETLLCVVDDGTYVRAVSIDMYDRSVEYNDILSGVQTGIVSARTTMSPAGEQLVGIINPTATPGEYKLLIAVKDKNDLWDIYDSVDTLEGVDAVIEKVKINDLTFVGSEPYLVYSWKENGFFSYITTVSAGNFGSQVTTGAESHPVGNLNWGVVLNMLAVVPTTDMEEPTFAFIGKPGYLIYAANKGNRLTVLGKNSSMDNDSLPKNPMLHRTDIEHLHVDNYVSLPVIDTKGSLTDMGVWDLRFPYSESIYANTGYTDPTNQNTVFPLDPGTGRFRIETPFWKYLKSTHKVKYLAGKPQEDLTPIPELEISAYSYRVDQLRELGTQVREAHHDVRRELTLLEGVPKYWQPHTNYKQGDVVFITTSNSGLSAQKASVDHLSGEDFDPSLWSQASFPTWEESTLYMPGDRVIKDNYLLVATTEHVSSTEALFESSNLGYWTLASHKDIAWEPNKLYWEGEFVYDTNRHLLYVVVQTHVSSSIAFSTGGQIPGEAIEQDRNDGKLRRVDGPAATAGGLLTAFRTFK